MDDGSSKNNRKQIFINIILVIFSFFIALFLGELFLRIFFPLSIISDPFLVQKGVPGVRWDQNGFRNEKSLNKVDIVALGDSLTEGFNAEINNAWPQALSAMSGKTVYNMGFGGYGPAQYYFLTDAAVKLNPDIIVVGFYLGNDLINAFDVVYNNENWKIFRDNSFSYEKNDTVNNAADDVLMMQFGYVPSFWQYKILKVRLWLRENSRLYSFLGDSSINLREKLKIADKTETVSDNIEKYLANNKKIGFVYNSGDIKTILNINYRLESVDIGNKKTNEGYRITKDIFSQLNKKIEGENKKLVIAIIPTKEFIYGEYFKKQDIKIDVDQLFWILLANESKLKEDFLNFCEYNNISCVDTASGMVSSLQNNIKIFSETTESHPTGEGYQAIAKVIFNYLKQSSFIQ